MTNQPAPKKPVNPTYIVGLMLVVVLVCGYLPMGTIFSNIASAREDNSNELPAYLLSALAVSPWVAFIIAAVVAGLLVLAFRHKDGADGTEPSDEFWSILLTAFGVASTSYALMFLFFVRISSYIPASGGLGFALLLFGCPPVIIFLLMGLRLALLPKHRNLKGWYGIGLLLTFVIPALIIFISLL